MKNRKSGVRGRPETEVSMHCNTPYPDLAMEVNVVKILRVKRLQQLTSVLHQQTLT